VSPPVEPRRGQATFKHTAPDREIASRPGKIVCWRPEIVLGIEIAPLPGGVDCAAPLPAAQKDRRRRG